MRILIACLALAACARAPVAEPLVYRLISLDGAPFAARATISFTQDGQIAGAAPCNSYGGVQVGRLPDFSASGLISTEMACQDLPAETAFFAALADMTRAEVTGQSVTLSNPAGRGMVFVYP